MRYVRHKAVQLFIVVFAVTILTFTLLSFLPGKREYAIGGVGRSPEEYAQIREQWHLNDPIPVQYFIWVKNLVTGDMGVSSAFNVPVSDLIKDRLPVSLYLMFYAVTLALIVAIPMGIFAAYRANGFTDRTLSTGAFALLSVPNYIMGVLLALIFAVNLKWLPALSEYHPLFSDPVDHFRNFALPAITLALGEIAVFMRLLRADMIATLQNDYITMARAKGMSTRASCSFGTRCGLRSSRSSPPQLSRWARSSVARSSSNRSSAYRAWATSPCRPSSAATSSSCRCASSSSPSSSCS